VTARPPSHATSSAAVPRISGPVPMRQRVGRCQRASPEEAAEAGRSGSGAPERDGARRDRVHRVGEGERERHGVAVLDDGGEIAEPAAPLACLRSDAAERRAASSSSAEADGAGGGEQKLEPGRRQAPDEVLDDLADRAPGAGAIRRLDAPRPSAPRGAG
jgi:hypothetical protein